MGQRGSRGRPKAASDEAEAHVKTYFVLIAIQSTYTRTTHNPTNLTGRVGYNSSNANDWNHRTSQKYQELLIGDHDGTINNFRISYPVTST